MRILDRYIARNVVGATLTVLLVLLAIFTFFTFIEELEDLGRGTYTLTTAAWVVVLRIPGLVYDLLPIGALIGALLGLGALAERNEIAVVRCAGVAHRRLVWAVMKAALLFVLAAVLIGELVFPFSERESRQVRSAAIADRVASSSAHGFWARDGASFVNIRNILPGERFEDIDIFEFDTERRLTRATHAVSATYRDGHWELHDIAQTRFVDGMPVRATRAEQADWGSVLDPALIGMVAWKPTTLSMMELARYVDFARRNGQNAHSWEHALWVKLAYPLATAVMVFLAIPLVLRSSRSVTTGRRVLLGASIGLGFHILNQTSSHLGVVFGVPPSASALAPTLLLLGIGLLMSRRVA